MAAAIETPSGKDAGDENFQVGSILLPARLRPHVMAFYQFVRSADDIADNPDLEADEKLRRLELLDRALTGDDTTGHDFHKARALRASLAESGVTAQHTRDVLRAFMQDARKRRYADWGELMGYCRYSAAPVGRQLLDLHGEDPDLWRFSDPLCGALQILNHLQDCQSDYRQLDRVYLPLDVMAAAGVGPEALAAPHASRSLRAVLDRVLDGTADLLSAASSLPVLLRSRRLAAEAAVVLEMARHLHHALRRRDPLASRVELGRARFVWAGAVGLGRAVLTRSARRPVGHGARA